MGRRVRRLKRIQVPLLVLAMLTAVVWGASARWGLIWQTDSFQTAIAGGAWTFARKPGTRLGLAQNGLHFGPHRGWRWGGNLALPDWSGCYTWALPLWIVAAGLAAWPIAQLTLGGRPRAAECPSCGYSRAGLAPDARCPECGADVAPLEGLNNPNIS